MTQVYDTSNPPDDLPVGAPGIVVAGRAMVALATRGCDNSGRAGDLQSMARNLVSYFEIPVTDMDRAIDFYEAVFAVSLERTVIDGLDMALFPLDENGRGVSGALAKGDSYVPSTSGPRIYFFVDSIDETLSRVITKGGTLAYPKTSVGDLWVAEFEDCEGNQIALSSADG